MHYSINYFFEFLIICTLILHQETELETRLKMQQKALEKEEQTHNEAPLTELQQKMLKQQQSLRKHEPVVAAKQEESEEDSGNKFKHVLKKRS